MQRTSILRFLAAPRAGRTPAAIIVSTLFLFIVLGIWFSPLILVKNRLRNYLHSPITSAALTAPLRPQHSA